MVTRELNKSFNNNDSILIIEDDQGLSSLIKRMLVKKGLSAVQVFNGMDALQKVSEPGIILLLLDYKLPDMNGREILKSLGEKNINIPFIIMTGHGDEKIAVEMMKAGARDYIIKDSSFIDILPQVIDRIVGEIGKDKKLKQVEEDLKRTEERFHILAENSSDMIFRVSIPSLAFEYISPASEYITGYRQEDLIKSRKILAEIVHPEWLEEYKRQLDEIINGDVPSYYEYVIITENGNSRWINQRNAVLKNSQDEVVALEAIVTDITSRKDFEAHLKSSLIEKDILLNEVHHRTKNNMQIITSMLDLQVDYLVDEKDRELFRDSISRIKSMARIHNILYKSRSIAEVNFKKYILELSNELPSYFNSEKDINISVKSENITLGIKKAVPSALIINELVTNSIKYAFPDNSGGDILIEFRKDKDGYLIQVSDNGIGIPAEILSGERKSLGLNIVDSLVKQLNGKLNINNGNGTVLTITFPAENS